jgi:hypothetical protein
VIKTTVYLPEALKRQLAKIARRRRVTEAQLIRQGVEQVVQDDVPRRPTFPLFRSGKPHLFDAPDEELLRGFGER